MIEGKMLTQKEKDLIERLELLVRRLAANANKDSKSIAIIRNSKAAKNV
jgi:hypothetical protein